MSCHHAHKHNAKSCLFTNYLLASCEKFIIRKVTVKTMSIITRMNFQQIICLIKNSLRKTALQYLMR